MRLKITDLGPKYFTASSTCEGSEVELAPPLLHSADKARRPDGTCSDAQDVLTVSDQSTCVACGGQRFETYLEQRAHFATDLHKHNARRRAGGRPALSPAEFDALAELMDSTSIGSISASDDGHSSDEEGDAQAAAERAERLAAAASVKVEFVDPTKAGQFILLYKVALPDLQSLASLEGRGGWAVFMSGGGHFAASIWDKAGNVVKQKTFHRYTSRAKQGGSQVAADSQGGKYVDVEAGSGKFCSTCTRCCANFLHWLRSVHLLFFFFFFCFGAGVSNLRGPRCGVMGSSSCRRKCGLCLRLGAKRWKGCSVFTRDATCGSGGIC